MGRRVPQPSPSNRRVAGNIERSSAEYLLHRGAHQVGDKIIVRSDKRLRQHSPIYMNQQKVLAILGGIEAPALLILAKDGLVIGRKSTPARIEAISNIVVEHVDGHHHVHMDQPQSIAPIVEKFIATEPKK